MSQQSVLLPVASAQVQGLQLDPRTRVALVEIPHYQALTTRSHGGTIIRPMATSMLAIHANTENQPVAHLILLKALMRLIPLIVWILTSAVVLESQLVLQTREALRLELAYPLLRQEQVLAQQHPALDLRLVLASPLLQQAQVLAQQHPALD